MIAAWGRCCPHAMQHVPACLALVPAWQAAGQSEFALLLYGGGAGVLDGQDIGSY